MVCNGSDPYSQCQRCSNGYFFLNNGCYKTCPKGYWNDMTNYTCQRKSQYFINVVCNPICTACTGPASTTCSECKTIIGYNALGTQVKLGYLLISGSECVIPRCASGQYFAWSDKLVNNQPTGNCYYCDQTCKECVGPDSNQCYLCPPGYALQANHTCIPCTALVGYFTNDQYQCQEICGDGLLFVLPCDDGNLISGDGCSKSCEIEFGYICPTPNEPCIYTIAPTFLKYLINGQNLITIQFAHDVVVTSPESISTDNINVQITGQYSKYIFQYRVIGNYVPGTPFNIFQLALSDFGQMMLGTENIQISFVDPTQIHDTHGNLMTYGQYATVTANRFIYINPSQLAATAKGGQSIKYTFLSVFSFNVALKLLLNSSMQFLWGLVHALQIFNYLLFININFPENVQIFSNYLSISTGNFTDIENLIPNAADYLINMNDVASGQDNLTVPPTFVENGISPYFITAYGQQITMMSVGVFFIIPAAFIFHKLCKKVKIWEDIISASFFNFPLRSFVESYMQLIIQVILNTKVFKFNNYSQSVSTIIAFVFGVIALSLPFQAMNLIYKHRKAVKRSHWKKMFGMLTEELRAKQILQLYYYPIFMYQRLFIAGVIVYVYEYPLIQCLMVMLSNALMITYLVIVRPFKDENQQVTTVLDEFVIMICVGMFIALYYEEDPNKIVNYGWVIILTIIASTLKNFAIVIYFGVQQAREQMRKMFQAEDEQIDSPSTSNHSSSDENVNTEEVLEELDKDAKFKKWKEQVLKRRAEIHAELKYEMMNQARFSIIQGQAVTPSPPRLSPYSSYNDQVTDAQLMASFRNLAPIQQRRSSTPKFRDATPTFKRKNDSTSLNLNNIWQKE